MKVLLDSSTLIAAMLPDHVHHAAAHIWLSKAKAGEFEFVVSGHSVAEVYSVLTRLPRTPPITPPEAWQMLHDNVTTCATVVALTGNDYVALMESLSKKMLGRGLVYDAIIAKVAELAHVDRLVSLNESHFLKVWPNGAGRIGSALTAPPTTP